MCSKHLAIMLVVVRADQLADILPDLTRRRPRSRRVCSVPHHANITTLATLVPELGSSRHVLLALVSLELALTLTSYLYCFILNHSQLGHDLHHIR